MKNIVLLLFMLVSFLSVDAQVGLKGGFNYNAANYDIAGQAVENLKDVNSNNGWHIGLNYRGMINDYMYYLPEVMYSNTTMVFDYNGEDTWFYENVLDVNIIMGVLLADIFRGHAGLSGSFNLGTTQEDKVIETSFNSFRTGYVLGVGIDIYEAITLDISYKGSFDSDNGTATILGKEMKLEQNVSQILFSIGLMF